ncbi:MAG TPA: hypothetical protein VER04_24375 [Polyangiaceae bacterium]|nr:hypothetical protein [Polyangiaceae bacterium]
MTVAEIQLQRARIRVRAAELCVEYQMVAVAHPAGETWARTARIRSENLEIKSKDDTLLALLEAAVQPGEPAK